MINKDELVRSFKEALHNLDKGEQIVQIVSDDEDSIAVSMTVETWKGNKCCVLSLLGNYEGETLDNKLTILIDRSGLEEVFKESGGIDKLVDDVAAELTKTDSNPNKEGVPAG